MKTDPSGNQWFAIVNPNAGNGKGKKDWARISNDLRKLDLNFTENFTDCKGHAIILAKDAINAGFRKFICIGGDGTLNEIVNGAFEQKACGTNDLTLGLIPVGTGNDWGRMFGIPLNYEGASRIIKNGMTTPHDIGLVNFYNGKEKQQRYFINIAGLGFEAVVVKRTNYQKDKGKSGKAIYFYNLLMSLLSYTNTEAEVIADGITSNAKIFSLNVGNGRYCGGGMRQTPFASPLDGLLDVTVINGMGKIEIIRNLKILYNGKILEHPKVTGYKCRNLRVTSDSVLYIEADGESLGHLPAEFSIIPSAINIVYGTNLFSD